MSNDVCTNSSHKDCVSRSIIGSGKIDQVIEQLIKQNIAQLAQAKQALLNKGVPERYIVYVVKNHENGLGTVFTKWEHTTNIIERMRGANLVHELGSGREGQHIFCADGRDYDFLKQTLWEFKHTRAQWLDYLTKGVPIDV